MEFYLFAPDLFLRDIREERKEDTQNVKFVKKDLIPSSCDIRGHVKLFYNARETKAVLLVNWNKS